MILNFIIGRIERGVGNSVLYAKIIRVAIPCRAGIPFATGCRLPSADLVKHPFQIGFGHFLLRVFEDLGG